MILKGEKRILIPIFSEKDMLYLIKNIEKIDTEGKEFILLRLIDEQMTKNVCQRLRRDPEEYLSSIIDSAWNNLYYFQEELTKKEIHSKVSLKTGNALNELIDFGKKTKIKVILFSRLLDSGFEGIFKEKLLKNLLISWEETIIII
ncbi:hypothetical protein J7L48_02505 [bacterium]|nr:hypothetical protein [bacterium]